ncbi:NUDIX hydrolase [Pseudohoeflea coraliihabitans]|uniref:NUDIX domain-containing protein n=1 Tax=Pseudohoeflea coraliihabitans TaxID=2860393 RepID=A0ABS6WS98_9HYPH|nr:NUDIX domain-containing protein [Pseudohoeflea sp. DP4N28-3]MBW3098818.1 NUDIX domain-containing protein [Pseudohoeflea sp. DP4N28-3]
MSVVNQLRNLLQPFRPPAGPRRRKHARRAAGRQAAALVWRRNGNGAEILLITSRNAGRWILPKGWVEDGEDGAMAAAREAREEAGVIASESGPLIGSFPYHKVRPGRRDVRCMVDVYLLVLREEKESWPEMHMRETRWARLDEALSQIDEPALVALLRDNDTRLADLLRAE